MLPNKRSDIESNPTKMPQYAKTAPTKVSAVILTTYVIYFFSPYIAI